MMDWLETTRRHLSTVDVGRVMEGHECLDSTNTRAAAWIEAPHGAVVVAETQTAGRGRHGRSWEGGKGESLLFSVVLFPRIPRTGLGVLPLAVGLAVRAALLPHLPGTAPILKWPNDVLLNGRKCAGILIESTLMGSSAGALRVIAGIGINVNQPAMPGPLEGQATSLRQATGRLIPRPLLFAGVLDALEVRVNQSAASPESLLLEYESCLQGLNQPVAVRELGGETHRGTLAGVDPSGALRIQSDGGTRLFTAGQVTLDLRL